MTPLRVQMTEDMRVAGLAAGTQRIYLDGVCRLAKHYRRAPDQLSEAEVRAYLLGLRERGVAGLMGWTPPDGISVPRWRCRPTT
jgi:Phage integrase, N-terminal SAM-like domain